MSEFLQLIVDLDWCGYIYTLVMCRPLCKIMTLSDVGGMLRHRKNIYVYLWLWAMPQARKDFGPAHADL